MAIFFIQRMGRKWVGRYLWKDEKREEGRENIDNFLSRHRKCRHTNWIRLLEMARYEEAASPTPDSASLDDGCVRYTSNSCQNCFCCSLHHVCPFDAIQNSVYCQQFSLHSTFLPAISTTQFTVFSLEIDHNGEPPIFARISLTQRAANIGNRFTGIDQLS